MSQCRRIRVFFVTSNPPVDEMGGCILFYRQFVERDDYEVFVVTDRCDFSSSCIPYIIHEQPRVIRRLMRTRLSLFAHDYVHCFGGATVPKQVLDAARKFKPDLIMTGAETYMADMAVNLAIKLNLPVAAYFMDWPTFATVGHSWARGHVSNMFRRRYEHCDLAFGICPEMLEALGPHRNAHVFYPSGRPFAGKASKRQRPAGEPYTLLFAGNLGQWYGQMLESLAHCFTAAPGVQLRIAGRNASWGADIEDTLRREGVYLGYLKGAAYEAAIEKADALLLVMGFGEENRLIESTSFKSKLADYLTTGRPVIVWGPDYCTAARHALRHNFGEVVTLNDPQAVLTAAKSLATDAQHSTSLVENGRRFWEANLNGEHVMRQAYQAINSVIAGVAEEASGQATGNESPAAQRVAVLSK